MSTRVGRKSKNDPGHRPKFDDTKREAYLQLLREGGRRCQSAEAVGVNVKTVERAMKHDPEFASAVSEAEIMANEIIEDAMFATAKNGNVVAQQVWLYNRAPDKWADKRSIDHRGIPASAVAPAGDFDPKKLSDDELRQFEALLSKGRIEEKPRPPTGPSKGTSENGTLH